jgi:DNA-binding transcriptional LysR family regulator
VVASPALLRRLGTPKHPRELAQQPCVRFTATEGAAWCFREQGRRFTVPVRGPLDCNLSAPALEACAAGLGFGHFLSYQAGPYVRARRLRIVLADFELDPVDVNLVVPSARGLAWRTRVFLDFMKAALHAGARA